MSNIIAAKRNNGRKEFFLDYRVPPRREVRVWRVQHSMTVASNQTAHLDKPLFTLEDVQQNGRVLQLIPCEEELLFVQKLVAEWQVMLMRLHRGRPLPIVTPFALAVTYENIIGLKIWIRDHVAPVENSLPCMPLSRSASFMYLFGVSEFLDSVTRGGSTRSMTPLKAWISTVLPCFKFRVHNQDKEQKLDPTTSKYFNSLTVDLVNKELANFLNFVIRREGIVDKIPSVEPISHA